MERRFLGVRLIGRLRHRRLFGIRLIGRLR